MTQFYEFYTHIPGILLFLFITNILLISYCIGFIRFDTFWYEWRYSKTIIYSIIGFSFVIAPILDMFTKITSNKNLKTFLLNTYDHINFLFLLYGIITIIISALAIFIVNNEWWELHFSPQTKNTSLKRISIGNIITFFITFIFINKNITTSSFVLPSIFIIILIINIISYIYTKYNVQSLRNMSSQ